MLSLFSLTELSRRRASRLQLRSPPKPGGQGQEALQRTAGDRDVLHDALPAGAPIRYDWAGGVGITGAPAFCGNGALVIAGELVGRFIVPSLQHLHPFVSAFHLSMP